MRKNSSRTGIPLQRAADGVIAARSCLMNGLSRANRIFSVGFDGGRPLYRTMHFSA